MLDVHVLMMDYTPTEQHRQCQASIEEAVAQAGFPVRVHYLPGIYGHLGHARYRGYSLGDHPYVTHVDDDDYVRPDAFAILREHLEAQAPAVTTGENLTMANAPIKPMPHNRHHLAVYRRELLARQPYRHFKYYPDQFLIRQIPGIHVPECVYFLRINDNSGSRRCRRENMEEVERELALLKRPDLVALENLSSQQIAQLYDEMLDE